MTRASRERVLAQHVKRTVNLLPVGFRTPLVFGSHQGNRASGSAAAGCWLTDARFAKMHRTHPLTRVAQVDGRMTTFDVLERNDYMDIKRAGSQASVKGPSEWFTGTVRIDPLFPGHGEATAAGNAVTFETGARTAWHTHPLGQVLIVTAGCGWVQSWGEAKQEVRPGDVVWFEPGEKHWHGATATTAMTHLAIQEAVNGSPVDWMEHVTDGQYLELDKGGN